MIVVTGGSGFIGANLCTHLHGIGETVRIVDVAPPPKGMIAEFRSASILDAEKLPELFSGADAVIHLAANVDVQRSISDPEMDFQVNAKGTLNVLEAARKSDVVKVVYASSAAVYGNPVFVPISESHPLAPISPYGKSKLAAERHVLSFAEQFGMKNTALRMFNVYGRGQRKESQYSGVVGKFASAIAGGAPPLIYGDGEQTRDFVHVKDVSDAFAKAIKAKGCKSPINIGSGIETPIAGLYARMAEICGCKVKPKFLPALEGEIRRSVADITLAKKELKFSPKVSLDDGLADMLGRA